MRSLKTFALAGAVMIGATAVASAADLRYPQPVGLPPAPHAAPIAEASGWYLRGDIGIAALDVQKFKYSDNDPNFVFTSKQFSPQISGAIGAGYQVNSWARFDITGEYRGAAQFSAHDRYGNLVGGTGFTGTNNLRSRVSSTVFLANAYLDLGTWSGLTPYIGAGVGMTQNHVAKGTDNGYAYNYIAGVIQPSSGPSTATFAGATKSGLAYAVMAGVSADVSQNIKLDVGYRYLNLGKFESGRFACATPCTYSLQGKDLDAHELKVGLRYMFGGASYAPSPAPMAYPVEPRMIKKF